MTSVRECDKKREDACECVSVKSERACVSVCEVCEVFVRHVTHIQTQSVCVCVSKSDE